MKLFDEDFLGFLFVLVFEEIHFRVEVVHDCHVTIDEFVAHFSDSGRLKGGKGEDELVAMVLLDDLEDDVFYEAAA